MAIDLGESGRVAAWSGWPGRAWQAWFGEAGLFKAVQGRSRQVLAAFGEAGVARLGVQGREWPGVAGRRGGVGQV